MCRRHANPIRRVRVVCVRRTCREQDQARNVHRQIGKARHGVFAGVDVQRRREQRRTGPHSRSSVKGVGIGTVVDVDVLSGHAVGIAGIRDAAGRVVVVNPDARDVRVAAVIVLDPVGDHAMTRAHSGYHRDRVEGRIGAKRVKTSDRVSADARMRRFKLIEGRVEILGSGLDAMIHPDACPDVERNRGTRVETAEVAGVPLAGKTRVLDADGGDGQGIEVGRIQNSVVEFDAGGGHAHATAAAAADPEVVHRIPDQPIDRVRHVGCAIAERADTDVGVVPIAGQEFV